MTPEQEARLEYLEGVVARFMLQDRFYFEKNAQFADGRNVMFGGTIGTKLGTTATQKIALWGATPVVQAGAITAPSTPGGVYSSSEAQSAVDKINAIRTALKNAGLTA